MLNAVVAGLLLGGSLIVAIGAQNAYVIRQGVIGRHIGWIALFCAVSDALLIWAGLLGLGKVLQQLPWLTPVMTYGGAAFLLAYGLKAARRAMHPEKLVASASAETGLAKALAVCAAFTFLNPHVYLDTVILLGSVANSRPEVERVPFALGACLASFIWFFGLGFGARSLAGPLSRPTVWRLIDSVIAVIMFVLAIKLLLH
jgi:L-lysine exporter family protein LysE/ArgO